MSKPILCPPKKIICWKDHDLLGEFVAQIPAEHTYEDVANPMYFGNVNRGLKIGDMIRVLPQDYRWFAELLIVDMPKGMNLVYTRELRHISFEAGKLPAGWSIQYQGDIDRHTIFYNEQPKEKGFQTPDQARRRLLVLANVDETSLNDADSGGKSDERIALEEEADLLEIPYRADIKDAGLKKKIEDFKLAKVE